ncbi:MAG: DUF5671 domain-containing protein [Candidatus Komeilibacteria bacterium]|nr:DUF5671 domain-containing protein [Candidatus Komeilibacteria bacterium]
MKTPWIRVVYLYLMTAIGLVVLIIGAVTLLQLVLKVYIFTQADNDYYSVPKPASVMLFSEKGQAEAIKECSQLTAADKTQIASWLNDYQTWQDQTKNIDQKRSNRERQAAQAIAMILVGFPVYWLHWQIIKKDRKKEEIS